MSSDSLGTQATADQTIPSTSDDAKVLHAVIEDLQRLPDNAARERILHAVAVFLGIPLAHSSFSTPKIEDFKFPAHANIQSVSKMSFSDHSAVSPKQFMAEKSPETDVERVACLAYYLAHFRDTPHFKTLDISKLNTEAAQFKFSNAAVAVNNATLQKYLVPAIKGAKQLSAAGEQFVKALPDRELAKEIFQRMGRSKRNSARKIGSSNSERAL